MLQYALSVLQRWLHRRIN